MTDASTIAVLPQLTGVIKALTESEELLLRRIRRVRLDAIPSVVEKSPREGFLPSADPQIPVGQAITASSDAQPPFGQMKSSTGPLTPSPSEPDLSRTVIATDSKTSHLETRTPAPTTSGERMTQNGLIAPDERNVAVLAQAPTWPKSSSMGQVDVTNVASVDRDYNFFDELDARLARLDAPKSASAES